MRTHVVSIPLLAILLLYLAIATLYAVYTPAWQVPDEPAHYNYIRHIATGQGLPVLQPGDYCQSCLEHLTATRFPPGESVGGLRYEFHQPPLYYLLATPIFLAFGGALLPLRLLSVILGAFVVFFAYETVMALFPDRPWLALGTAAFVALLPQHVAMMAGVENDSLAEALLAATLAATMLYIRQVDEKRRRFRWLPVVLGLLTGLILVTKVTVAVVGPPVVALAVLWRAIQPGAGRRRIIGDALVIAVLALLFALPWWFRSMSVYGGLDIYGLARHNAVVLGQPRTTDWLAQKGVGPFLVDFAQTTFDSFWGQFGWMGVVLDGRLYLLLIVFSLLVLVGLVWRGANHDGWQVLTSGQRAGILLLLACIGLAVLAYLYYNLTFVQHQGRYLFPALIPIGLGVSAGLESLVRARPARPLAVAGLVVLLGVAAFGLLRRDLPMWSMAILAVTVAALLAGSILPSGWRRLAWLPLTAGLAVLSIVCLFLFIVPALT